MNGVFLIISNSLSVRPEPVEGLRDVFQQTLLVLSGCNRKTRKPLGSQMEKKADNAMNPPQQANGVSEYGDQNLFQRRHRRMF